VFGCILENAPENILQCCAKDRVEGAPRGGGGGGLRSAFFKNGLRKN
jgi:hypothetical protein